MPPSPTIAGDATLEAGSLRSGDEEQRASGQLPTWPILPLGHEAATERAVAAERRIGAPRPGAAVAAYAAEHQFAPERPAELRVAAERQTVAERHVVAARSAVDLGEAIDRWPTLPDPVPDEESSQMVGLEAERWTRLEREQRIA